MDFYAGEGIPIKTQELKSIIGYGWGMGKTGLYSDF